ncbi:FGGY family carbohydrate kinase [Histidinibacterium lentulum]|uniref:ATP:glycerol 3-phosphotransferase n=1 Tax=Histidinibacterium lentulum TaxID=2480588 RepID=A0A3N2R7A6_9RHOB|nr:FGGY family carbohydrate kinase [Histidinibacterium lentulum]ROU03206.1 glycerol kinase [Histidinibacterium lentulum]
MLILAIDQGTTNTKALVFDLEGRILRSASASCRTDYPAPGWAEQSAAEIWATTRTVIAEATAGLTREIAAIGIANQRETLVVWDAGTSAPVGPAPIWQCRRTADACARLIEAGHPGEVAERTGLGINPLFPATKLAWVLENRPEAARLADAGRLRAGTVDAWLLWNFTGGAAFATDHSNASRTLLFDTGTLDWGPDLARLFGVPLDCLPRAMASDSLFGRTAEGATALPAGVPIHAMMGDSHAALFGHGVRGQGQVKATYGTGSSLMTLTQGRPRSLHGLSGTVGWTQGARTSHALEGNITVSAQAAAFAADLLGLPDAAALSALAESVQDSGGVVFVPALAGLGAPHWDDAARGLVTGLSLGSGRAHLARATLEAIAHQVADVFEAMEHDLGRRLDVLSADGGASGNGFLMQLQADLLGRPVRRPALAEIGALGVATMAAGALGETMAAPSDGAKTYRPGLSGDARATERDRWRAAIARATG